MSGVTAILKQKIKKCQIPIFKPFWTSMFVGVIVPQGYLRSKNYH
jgi:hypothetical protein